MKQHDAEKETTSVHTAASERGATVEFQDIGVTFGEVAAVKRFNLSIGAGEFLTLLGPSGSGKTTALNVVAGFLDPSVGDILIGGRSISALPTEKRNIGMVFQNYSLFPHMSVFDNVAFPLKMRRAPRQDIEERVSDALKLVHLDDYGTRMPNQLSGGQRQRIAFARAIVFEPKVLLMDEPLGALDLKLREHMQLEIKHYQEQIGCTVIYVTHDQGEALTLSDRIVVMNNGEIVQVGTPQEVYDVPSTRFAAEFIGESNILTLQRAKTSERSWRIKEIDAIFGYSAVEGTGSAREGRLSVRPEKIKRVHAEMDRLAEHMQFEGTVKEVVFLGDVIRYSVEVATGAFLTFKEHRTGTTRIMHMDESVKLGFLPSDAVYLSDEM